MTKQQLFRRRSALVALPLAVAALAAGPPAAMAAGIDRIGADAHGRPAAAMAAGIDRIGADAHGRPAAAEVAAPPEEAGGATADVAWDGTSM